MKNLRLTLVLTVLLFSIESQAQQLDTTWVRQFDRVPSSTKVHISTLNSNKFLIHQAENYYEINGNGDSIGGGVLDTALGQWGPTFLQAHDGALYAGAYKNNAPIIHKLDTNYNILWSTPLAATTNFGQGVEAVMVDSGFVYVSGSEASSKPFIAKLDSAGNILWQKSFPQTTFSNLTNLMKLKDGNYLANGNLDDYPLAFKFNSNGDTLWSYYETIFISFSYAAAAEKANGNTILVMRNTLIELDNSGARVDSSKGINDYQAAFINADTLYLFGTDHEQQFSSKKYAFVETRDLNLDSTNAWRKTWDSHPFADNIFSSVVRTPNGFIAAGKHRDSINVTNNTYNILAARFNDSVANTNTRVYEISKQLQPNQFYPNPANHQITLNLKNIEEIILTDILGIKIALERNGSVIDVSSIPSGIYILNVVVGNTWYHSKVIIQH